MPGYSQDNRRSDLKTPLGKDVLLFKSVTGAEGISKLFSFTVDALAENDVDIPFEKLLGKPCTVTLYYGPEGKEKTFLNGVARSVSQGWRDSTFTFYRMELVPEMWFLTRVTRSRIFQQKSVKEILQTVFAGLSFDLRLQGKYEPRDYCVQYRETDFDFASRLMEEEGIFYFFEHSDGSHKLVLGDKPSAHPQVPGPSPITYEELAGGFRDDDRIWGWTKTQALRSGKVTLWDHCFELPHKHLEAEAPTLPTATAGTVTHKLKVGGNDKFELYDWPGGYAQRFDGVSPSRGDRPDDVQKIFRDNQRTTEIRMDQEAAPALRTVAGSNAKHLRSGHRFTLKRHVNADGEYVIVENVFEARQTADYRSKDSAMEYTERFTCQPISLPFRPLRLTPKAVVAGCQTAVVVGPPGEEIFTDKYGRVKVQFHWDRDGKNNADSSCWIRVAQPIAGRRWGASFWPRIGQEVVVDFLEGDPDQPIITGVVYNADQMPPYLGNGPDDKHTDDNKVMGVKSNSTKGGVGFNEWRFDDTKDKEQIFVHAQKDMDTRVKNDLRELICHDRSLIVGDEKKYEGDYKELIYRDRHIRVKRDHFEAIRGDMKLFVGADGGSGNVDLHAKGARKTLIDASDHLHVKSNLLEKVDGDHSLTVGGSSDEKVGLKWAAESGMEIHLKAGMKVVIEAGMQLTLKGPGGFVDIGPAGVTIQGTMVLINSGGAAGSGSGAQPTAPEDASDANPVKPDEADNAKTGQKSC